MEATPPTSTTPPAAPRFSVVVAAHQTGPWLRQAIGSLESQSFRDFEAIIHVEESTDDSLAIARAAAARDSRFLAVPAPKSGSASAGRNFGILRARGEYLVFLDGDDWLAPGMLGKIDAKLRLAGPLDILAFAAVSTDGSVVDWATAPRMANFAAADSEGVFSGLDAMRAIRKRNIRFLGYSWMNVFRTEFLRRHRLFQTEGLVLEDAEHLDRALFFARRVSFLDEPLYAYRRRNDSASTRVPANIVFSAARQIRNLVDFTRAHSVPPDIVSFWADQWLGFFYWMLFHPATSRKLSDTDIREALGILAGNGGLALVAGFSGRASRFRRIAWPFVRLAAKGWLLPARLFFRKFYYPLVALRERRRQDRNREPRP